MRPGDVVLLDMNGEKWAFVNLKRGGCARVRPSVRAPVVPSVLRAAAADDADDDADDDAETVSRIARARTSDAPNASRTRRA
jgi:hypothetical protein